MSTLKINKKSLFWWKLNYWFVHKTPTAVPSPESVWSSLHLHNIFYYAMFEYALMWLRNRDRLFRTEDEHSFPACAETTNMLSFTFPIPCVFKAWGLCTGGLHHDVSVSCTIWGSHSVVVKEASLLSRLDVLLHKWFLTFRTNQCYHLQDQGSQECCFTLKMKMGFTYFYSTCDTRCSKIFNIPKDPAEKSIAASLMLL